MKFFFAFENTNPNTRVVFENASSSPKNNAEDYSGAERSEAKKNTNNELSSLKEKLDAGIPVGLDDQINILVRISRNESIQDLLSDSRGVFSKMADSAGSFIEAKMGLSQENLTAAQRKLDWRDESQIIRLLSKDAKLRFLTEYRDDSVKLFTDIVGKDTYRVQFYGDTFLEGNADFMRLLPDKPKNKYIVINGEYYARTSRGYAGFHPEGIAGKRATVGSETQYKTLTELPEDAANSKVLKESRFAEVETPEARAQLEINRNINTYASQNWKSLINIISTESEGLPALSEFNNTVTTRFRDFMDGNIFVQNISNPGEKFSLPGVAGSIEALNVTEDPAEFRKKIEQAMSLVEKYVKNQNDKIQTELKSDISKERRDDLIKQSKEFQIFLRKLFPKIEKFLETQEKNDKEALTGNAKLMAHKLKDILNESNTMEFITEFDRGIRKMLNTGAYSKDNAIAFALDLVSNLGTGQRILNNEEKQKVKKMAMTRVNIIVKESGQDALQASINARMTKAKILALQNNNPVVQKAFANANIYTTDDINQESLTKVKKAIDKAYKEGTIKMNLEAFIKTKNTIHNYTIEDETAQMNKKTMNQKAINAEKTHKKINKLYSKQLDSKTAEGKNFDKTANIIVDYKRNYMRTHNGQRPKMSTQELVSIQKRIESGKESVNEIRKSLGLEPEKETSDKKETNKILTPINPENLPSGAGKAITLEGKNHFKFSVGKEFIEVKNNKMFPFGAEGLAKEWLSMPAMTENVLAIQIGSAVMNAGVEDGQEGLGIMFKKMGKQKFQTLLQNLSAPRMGRLLQPREIDGLKAIKNRYRDISIIFKASGLLTTDGQADPRKTGGKFPDFFELLVNAANRNFKELDKFKG